MSSVTVPLPPLSSFSYHLRATAKLLTNLPDVGVDVLKGSGPGVGARSEGITFDRFVRACVVIKQVTESFQRLDTDRDGWVQINYEQFMHTVLSLP